MFGNRPQLPIPHNYEPNGFGGQQSLLALQQQQLQQAARNGNVPQRGNLHGMLQANIQDPVNGTIRPRMDIYEDAENNVVSAVFELLGASKDDVRIDVQSTGLLTVSAEIKHPQSVGENSDNFAIRERLMGSYSRAIRLPPGVKEEEIRASMENGVLVITFPKSAPELPAKRINIS